IPEFRLNHFKTDGWTRYDAGSDPTAGQMRRREFITLLGGAAATWPLAVRAQQGERIRTVAVLSSAATDTSDPETQTYVTAFVQALQQLGWESGHNLRI